LEKTELLILEAVAEGDNMVPLAEVEAAELSSSKSHHHAQQPSVESPVA
jgi:hypothetical protein